MLGGNVLYRPCGDVLSRRERCPGRDGFGFVIGHRVGVEEGIHALPVATVDDLVQVHPMLDHLGLGRREAGVDFSTLLLGQDEVGFGERGKASHYDLLRTVPLGKRSTD